MGGSGGTCYLDAAEAASSAEIGIAPDGVGTCSRSPHRVNVTISPFAEVLPPVDSTASTGSDRALAVMKRVVRPPPPGAAPEMLFTHLPSTFTRLPAVNVPEGVTLASAEERARFAVTDWNAASVDCTEIQRPARVDTSELGSLKKDVNPLPFPEMYATPPTRTVDASALPMATVCAPDCIEESWTTLPVAEPEKNRTVILADPAWVAAASECSSTWSTDPDDRDETAADASEAIARPSRQATTVSPARAGFDVMAAAGRFMTAAP